MRVLVTIPHVFNPKGGGKNGSLSPDPQPRIAALTQCLQALHGIYGASQFYFKYTDNLQIFSANQENNLQLDIIICTSQGLHLLNEINISNKYYQHYPFQCELKLLGFECHAVLKSFLGQYDYYCYLEDDLILSDPYFFKKLAWFHKNLGDNCLLQPNRFELVISPDKVEKYYVEVEVQMKTGLKENFAHHFQDNLTVGCNFLGQYIIIKRAANPHSGCFFLNAAQMEYWAKQDYFLDKDLRFFGPLESAASLGIAKAFRIYKPAPENANFLEIQHYGESCSNMLLEYQNTITFK